MPWQDQGVKGQGELAEDVTSMLRSEGEESVSRQREEEAIVLHRQEVLDPGTGVSCGMK